MTTSFAKGQPQGPHEVEMHHDHGPTTGVLEVLAAAGGIALAIIGLATGSMFILDAIAIIVLGAAFLFERWAVTQESHEGMAPEAGHSAMSAESLAGWAGVVLGILTLLRIAPTVLAPVAVILFGVGLVLGSRISWRSARMFTGVCTIALGILALVQIYPRTLSLIGLLAVGATLLLTGPAVSSRLHHHAVHRPA